MSYWIERCKSIKGLVDGGFSVEEAERLVSLQERVTVETESEERVIEANRRNFVRWLIAHGRLDDGGPGEMDAVSLAEAPEVETRG